MIELQDRHRYIVDCLPASEGLIITLRLTDGSETDRQKAKTLTEVFLFAADKGMEWRRTMPAAEQPDIQISLSSDLQNASDCSLYTHRSAPDGAFKSLLFLQPNRHGGSIHEQLGIERKFYKDTTYGFTMSVSDMLRMAVLAGVRMPSMARMRDSTQLPSEAYRDDVRITQAPLEALTARITGHYSARRSFNTSGMAKSSVNLSIYKPLKEAIEASRNDETMRQVQQLLPESGEYSFLRSELERFRVNYLAERYGIPRKELMPSRLPLLTLIGKGSGYLRQTLPKMHWPEFDFRTSNVARSIPVDVQDRAVGLIIESAEKMIEDLAKSLRGRTGRILLGTEEPLDTSKRGGASIYWNPNGDTAITGPKSWRERNTGSPKPKFNEK